MQLSILALFLVCLIAPVAYTTCSIGCLCNMGYCESCIAGYVRNGNVCEPCPSNCEDCVYSLSSLSTTCTLCNPGYGALSDGTCALCSSDCLTCLAYSYDSCDGSSDGFPWWIFVIIFVVFVIFAVVWIKRRNRWLQNNVLIVAVAEVEPAPAPTMSSQQQQWNQQNKQQYGGWNQPGSQYTAPSNYS